MADSSLKIDSCSYQSFVVTFCRLIHAHGQRIELKFSENRPEEPRVYIGDSFDHYIRVRGKNKVLAKIPPAGRLLATFNYIAPF